MFFRILWAAWIRLNYALYRILYFVLAKPLLVYGNLIKAMDEEYRNYYNVGEQTQ